MTEIEGQALATEEIQTEKTVDAGARGQCMAEHAELPALLSQGVESLQATRGTNSTPLPVVI